MDIQIRKYCRIQADKVLLNGEIYFEPKQKPGEAHQFLTDIYNRLEIDYRKFYKMDMLSKLGFLSAELLMEGFEKEQPKENFGIVLFNGSSSLEADKAYQQTIQDGADYFPSPSVFVYTLPNIVTGEIAIRNKIHGETAFYVFSQPEYQQIVDIAKETMLSAGLNYLLVGWLEVCQDMVDGSMILCETTEQGVCALNAENIKRIISNP